MFKRNWLAGLLFLAIVAAVSNTARDARAVPPGQPYDWGRFYYYPYVHYPLNFYPPYQYDNLYYRYPQERRIPVYNADWHNFYPSAHPYHKGHAFILDVF